MGPQPVPKQKVAMKLIAVGGAHVEMMRWPTAAGSVARHIVDPISRERLTPRNSEVSLMTVAETYQPTDDIREDVPRRDHNIDINDRLGRQTRDGCASDVLDPQCEATQGAPVHGPERLEDHGPLGIVRNDDHGSEWLGSHLLFL